MPPAAGKSQVRVLSLLAFLPVLAVSTFLLQDLAVLQKGCWCASPAPQAGSVQMHSCLDADTELRVIFSSPRILTSAGKGQCSEVTCPGSPQRTVECLDHQLPLQLPKKKKTTSFPSLDFILLIQHQIVAPVFLPRLLLFPHHHHLPWILWFLTFYLPNCIY